MKQEISKFLVDVVRLDRIPDVPGSWTTEEYRQILQNCDFDWPIDFTDDELPDYAIITLLDLSPEEAAKEVLKVKLSNQLSNGQINNLTHEMQEERMWEEYPNLALHEKLFYCHVLLNQAFPKVFPNPEAAKCVLEVTAQNEAAKGQLKHANESFIVRLLADGMNDHGILKRLFGQQLMKAPFTEAEHIVWQYRLTPSSEGGVKIQLYSSWYWLTPLLEVSHYESSAFGDLELV